MTRSAVRMLVRDELVGFFKSKVMFVLWVLLPALAGLGYFLIPQDGESVAGGSGGDVPATFLMSALVSGLAGTIAAVMVAVDIIGEKSRKVYQLIAIRPIPREAIVWAKFVAVFSCVTLASVFAVSVGVVIDLVRGVALPPETFIVTAKALGSAVGIVAVSAAVGVLFGVVTRSVLVAVILVIYVGQNLTLVPSIPMYFDLGDGWYWIIIGITAAATTAVMWVAGAVFRRAEL